jgi:hypothetical protein
MTVRLALFASIPIAFAFAGCGGTTASIGLFDRDGASEDAGPDARAPRHVDAAPNGPETGDEGGDRDARPPQNGDDGSPPDAPSPANDSGPPGSGCFSPPARDAGLYYSCSDVACPAGTVCAQSDYDVGAFVRCVAVPPSCNGTPTCACMESAAEACVDPDPRFGCMDVDDEEGGFYLDFPCGCA